MGSYAELTSRGSFNENTRSGRLRSREEKAADRDQRELERNRARREATRPSEEAAAAWTDAQRYLAESVADTTFALWFEPLRALGERDGSLVLCGPRHVVRWVRRRYPELLKAALEASPFKGVVLVFDEPTKGEA